MKILTLSAHVEGQAIRLDEPFELPPDAKLLITVLPDSDAAEHADWRALSLAGLSLAYSDDEPDYTSILDRKGNQ